jgi:cytochrome c556
MSEQVFHDTAPMDAEAPMAEVTKVKETAERMANGDYPADADQTRALAGLIHQLAEQVERLASGNVDLGPDAPLAAAPED